MKISLLIALVVVGVALCGSKTGHSLKHSIRHHSAKKRVLNMSRAGLHTPLRLKKEVDVKTLILKKSQDFLDKQKLNNEAADAAWAENPAGRSELKKVYQPENELVMSGEVYTRVIQKGVEDDNMSAFEKLQYKLNDNMLYIMSNPDDFRNVQYGFNLMEVPMKSDKMEQAQCCARVEPQIHEVEINLYNFKGFCFRIDLAHQNWLFCDENVKALMDFHKTLIDTIIKAWFRHNLPGRQVPTGISESQCASLPFSWVPAKQADWACRCNRPSSMSQSPIAMGSELPDVKHAEDEVLGINFVPTYSITYGLIIQEPEFYAQYGQFMHQSDEGTQVFNAYKFVFKVGKGEHQIADLVNENIVGELHIHATSTQGKAAVLAVQFTTGRENNKFVYTLNPTKWDFKKSLTAKDGEDPKICLKPMYEGTKFELQKFFEQGKVATDKSFFRYQGSLTKPPCSEQVEWFVMRHPAEVSASQLNLLKQYGLTNANISPSNIRQVQPLNGRTYSLSITAPCPDLPPKKIEPPQLDYKYLKMSHTTRIPAMAAHPEIAEVFAKQGDQDNVAKISMGDDLILTNLPAGEKGEPPKEYSPETIKILMTKFLANKAMDSKDVDMLTKGLNKQESKISRK